MLWPNGTKNMPTISSGFGPRRVTIAGASSNHMGTDFIGYSTVRAVAAGKVIHVGWRSGWGGGGYMVWVQHDGFVSRSLHLVDGSAVVRVGDSVAEGQALGTMGNTGINGGRHHHLEIVHNGAQVDPVPFITARLGGLAGLPSAPLGVGSPVSHEEDNMIILIAMSNSSDGTVRKGQAYADTLTAPLALLSKAETDALDFWASRGIPYRRAEWDGDPIRALIDVRGVRPIISDSGRSDYTRVGN